MKKLKLATEKPLLALRVLEAGTPVVVDFKNLTLDCLYPVVVAMAALPPFLVTQRTQAVTMI